jgi:hypothetical protein
VREVVMQRSAVLSKGLDDDIAAAHRRFLAAMDQRRPNRNGEAKERYFVVLSLPVGKLECDTKSVRDILREMLAEAAAHLLHEINTPG